jgi:hypothetical protein
MTDRPEITNIRELGQQQYRWPAMTETFASGWAFDAAWSGRSFRLRHLVGTREVYGRERVHTVTFVGANPSVEGVAADDYTASCALLSVLRVQGKKHVREPGNVPTAYAEFEVVSHRDEIAAAHSPRSLAVKIREYDLALWAHHALLRARDKRDRS